MTGLRGKAATPWPTLPTVVPVTTFAPEPFEVIRPFSVVIQPSGEDFVATFFDANINATGETQEDAFAALKDVLLATLRMLVQLPDDQLGPGPRRQKAVLATVIREVI
jgi:predicted RNase H-like HicB family nuclease